MHLTRGKGRVLPSSVLSPWYLNSLKCLCFTVAQLGDKSPRICQLCHRDISLISDRTVITDISIRPRCTHPTSICSMKPRPYRFTFCNKSFVLPILPPQWKFGLRLLWFVFTFGTFFQMDISKIIIFATKPISCHWYWKNNPSRPFRADHRDYLGKHFTPLLRGKSVLKRHITRAQRIDLTRQ